MQAEGKPQSPALLGREPFEILLDFLREVSQSPTLVEVNVAAGVALGLLLEQVA